MRAWQAIALGCAGLTAPRDTHEAATIAGDLRLDMTLALEHQSTSVICEHGGEMDLDGEGLPSAFQLRWLATWQDDDSRRSDGQLLGFDRTYGALKLDLECPIGTRSLTSALEGEAHRWRWSDKSSAYERSGLSSLEEDASKALDSLESDLSFSWILPADDFSEPGREWHLAPEDLIESLWPGGFGVVRPLSGGDCSQRMVHIAVVPGVSADALLWPGSIDGQVKAKLLSGGPGQVALIQIEYSMELELSIEDWFELACSGEDKDWSSADYLDEMMHYGGEGLTIALRGGGHVEWSVDHGHLVSVELTGEIETQSDLHWSYHWDAPQIEEFFGERCETWKGRLELAGTVERVE